MLRVEAVEVHRRTLHQFFHLALAHLLARLLGHKLHRRIERDLRGLFGRLAPQPQRVLLGRQVQFGIQRMQARYSRRCVAQALHPYLTEHGGEPPLMQALLAVL